MTPLSMLRLLVLAQSTGDTLSDFLWQVRGLIAFVCALGLLWVALLVLTIQRRAEDKRRKKLGMDPLPNMWVSLYRQVTGQAEPPARAARGVAPAQAADSAALPTPDLDMLTGQLDEDGDAGSAQPEPARSAPAEFPAASRRGPAPEPDAAALEQDFMFDDEPYATERNVPGAPPDSVEVLRVYRDLSDGTLIVTMGEQQFSTVDEMRSADLERRFTKIVRELAILVRDAQQATKRPPRSRRTPQLQKSPRAEETDESAAPPRPTPQVPPPPSVAESTPQAETPPDKPAASPGDSPPQALGEQPDDDMPSMAPGAMLRGMTRAAFGNKPETPPVEEPQTSLSIAEQIDQLLQARLAKLPEYRGRTIKVEPSPLGGVRIRVDDTFYEGVGEIEDPDVRALLQAVVREWEQRS